MAWGHQGKCLGLTWGVGKGITEKGAFELSLGATGVSGGEGRGVRSWWGFIASSPRNGPAQRVSKLRGFYQKIPSPFRRKECGHYISVVKQPYGTSLGVQWLRVHTSTTRGTGLIPDGGTKIPHATCSGQSKKQKKWMHGWTRWLLCTINSFRLQKVTKQFVTIFYYPNNLILLVDK